MALVAAVAVALATWCAAAALGGAAVGSLTVPGALLAVALAPGVARSARGPRRVLPEGRDIPFLTAVTLAGLGALYLAGWTNGAHVGQVARLLPLAAAGLGLLWPQPNMLRYSLLLAVGSLVGVAVLPAAPPWAVAATLASAALGAVATNRLASTSGSDRPGTQQLGTPSPTNGRRLATEAGAVLAVVGILAAVAAALVPPPPGDGSGLRGGGRDPGDAAPVVELDQILDAGAGRGPGSDKIVFRIAADGPDLWRGTTFDHWDGARWARSPDAALQFPEDDYDGDGEPGISGGPPRDRPSFVPPGIGDPPEAQAEVDPDGGARFAQRVTVEARGSTVVVAAARPVQVTLPYGSVGVGDDASLRPPYPLVRGQSYTVASTRSAPGAALLRSLGDATATVPGDVAGRYLQLPPVPAPVRALAAELTVSSATTYDKARALEAWLDANVTSSTTAAPVPEGADPLEHLLAERAGPPERISAAFAVMLRALGIPSRPAVGFLPGKRAGLSGDFEVRGRDAYAWVEVWFPTAGWQRFDPSGKAPPPGARDDSLWDRLLRILGQLWPLLLLLVVAATGWLAWVGTRWWRRRAAVPWATRYFARLERAGRARGRPRSPEETPNEYAAGLADSVLPDPRIREVGELVTVAAYSDREPAPEDRERAEAVLRQAARAAPVRRFRRHTRPGRAKGPTIPVP